MPNEHESRHSRDPQGRDAGNEALNSRWPQASTPKVMTALDLLAPTPSSPHSLMKADAAKGQEVSLNPGRTRVSCTGRVQR